MRGYDVIRELYQGNLHPCDRGFRSDTEFAITMDAFTAHEKWLRENLNGEAIKRFEELISCHNNIVHTMSYENFRTGFQLGVMMVMEAISENETTFFELRTIVRGYGRNRSPAFLFILMLFPAGRGAEIRIGSQSDKQFSALAAEAQDDPLLPYPKRPTRCP